MYSKILTKDQQQPTPITQLNLITISARSVLSRLLLIVARCLDIMMAVKILGSSRMTLLALA